MCGRIKVCCCSCSKKKKIRVKNIHEGIDNKILCEPLAQIWTFQTKFRLVLKYFLKSKLFLQSEKQENEEHKKNFPFFSHKEKQGYTFSEYTLTPAKMPHNKKRVAGEQATFVYVLSSVASFTYFSLGFEPWRENGKSAI